MITRGLGPAQRVVTWGLGLERQAVITFWLIRLQSKNMTVPQFTARGLQCISDG